MTDRQVIRYGSRPTQSRPAARVSGSMPSGSRGAMQCHNCREYGHIRNYCPKPQRPWRSIIPPAKREYAPRTTEGKLRTINAIRDYNVQHVTLKPPTPEYLLPLRVEDQGIDGMVDTGASVTCMDAKVFYENYSDTVELTDSGKVSVTGFAGQPMLASGVARLNYGYLDRHGKPQEVQVATIIVNGMTNPLIIGRDFIKSVNLTWDNQSGEVHCDAPQLTTSD